MQRLVYAPKVYAWVKLDGSHPLADKGPFNLTPYITGGSVTRRINKVSSAELTIRNPQKKFTSKTKEGLPFFRPMDPITIWMSRLNNYPVQVFTGYIDRSPYLQLHPGVVNIMASCTLKRLLHTYWDPALPYVEEFMREYNWIVNRQTGTLDNRLNTSQDLIDQNSDKDDDDRETWIEKYQPWNKPDANEEKLASLELKDGSVGKLLYATLKHVGNWDPNTIKIEKLPPDLIEHVTNIYYAFHEDSEAAKKEIEQYLRKLIGEGDFSGGGAGIGLGSGDLVAGPIAKKIFCFFVENGFSDKQAAGFVGNFYVESGGFKLDAVGDGGSSYGLAQWQGSRRTALEALAQRRGKPVTDLSVQLEHVINELNGVESAALTSIKSASSVRAATDAICNDYERPSIPHIEARRSHAEAAYRTHSGKCGANGIEDGDA
jgi:hypothetical protein